MKTTSSKSDRLVLSSLALGLIFSLALTAAMIGTVEAVQSPLDNPEVTNAPPSKPAPIPASAEVLLPQPETVQRI